MHACLTDGDFAAESPVAQQLVLLFPSQLAQVLLQVTQLLFSSCETEEECRNVVAECLGHLALLYPSKTLPLLQQQSQVRGQDSSSDYNPPAKRRRMVWSCHTLLRPSCACVAAIHSHTLPHFLACTKPALPAFGMWTSLVYQTNEIIGLLAKQAPNRSFPVVLHESLG